MPEETVTISISDYNILLSALHELECLHAYGGEHWEWYEEAIQAADDEEE